MLDSDSKHGPRIAIRKVKSLEALHASVRVRAPDSKPVAGLQDAALRQRRFEGNRRERRNKWRLRLRGSGFGSARGNCHENKERFVHWDSPRMVNQWHDATYPYDEPILKSVNHATLLYMAHHAYFVAGEREQAVARARAFAERTLGETDAALDIAFLTFELFSVDDARRLITTASISGMGGQKVIIASMTRIFHEAQNALLKILEEPPADTTIFLCVPSEGVFIPTLRSRLLPLPDEEHPSAPSNHSEGIAERFMAASPAEREKIAGKLVEQSKSDKEETKQQARREAIELLQGLTQAAHAQLETAKTAQAKEDALALLEDLASFMPILYERSAPLKLMLEHLLLVIPTKLGKAKV